jgi:hypothetical protein
MGEALGPMGSEGHMRFVGGTIYCPVAGERLNLGPDHRYGDAFRCPVCGVQVPARSGLAGRPRRERVMSERASNGTVMAWGANDAGELGNGTKGESDG